MSSIIQKECIVFDIDTYDKNEAILTLVKKLKEQIKLGKITSKEAHKYLAGHMGYIKYANTRNLENKLFYLESEQ